MQKVLIALAVIATTGFIGGCSFYRIDVPQGNIVTQEMVDRLKPGMTRRQVRAVMGTPLVRDPFHADRWDYIYYFKPGRGEVERRHLALYFEADRLTRIEGDLRPRPQSEIPPQPPTVEHRIEGPAKKRKGWLGRLREKLGGDVD